MRLFQFIAIDGPLVGFQVRNIANGVWTEDQAALDLDELIQAAKAEGKTPAVAIVDVEPEVVDWVGTRGYREESPAKKQVRLYPGSSVSLVDIQTL